MKCWVCGQQAGFLRSYHRPCRDAYRKAEKDGEDLVMRAACSGRSWDDALPELQEVLRQGRVPETKLPSIVRRGVARAVEDALDDNLLDETEERNVGGFLGQVLDAGIGDSSFDVYHERMNQAAVLRMVLEGRNPVKRMHPSLLVGFNFMKSESPIWAFEDVGYQVLKTRVSYTGGSAGMSFRVAKGVYMRTGGFRGRRHVEEEHELADTGRLVITNKHVYFGGERNRFRVRFDRIVGFRPFQDGFEMTRDRMNAKPEGFITGDGWFVYNIVVNAANVENVS